MVTTAIFYSCTKHATEEVTEEQAVQNLVASDDFIVFSHDFITDFAALMQYHRSPVMLSNKNAFLAQVKLAGNSETALTGAYRAFSLDYEKVLVLKNKLDNDLLKLVNQNPFLQRFAEEQVQRILVTAVTTGLQSSDQRWTDAKAQINLDLKNSLRIKPMQTDGQRSVSVIAAPGLSVDEVWACIKQALGVGTAGILGIGGVLQLAKQGIQTALISITKWVASKAGWFGLAITVIDFGVCVYKESGD